MQAFDEPKCEITSVNSVNFMVEFYLDAIKVISSKSRYTEHFRKRKKCKIDVDVRRIFKPLQQK